MGTVSNIPDRVDIRHRQGSVQTIPLRFKLDDGTPEDISGRGYELSVKKSATSNAPFVTYSTSNAAIIIDDAPNGLATLTIDDVATPLDCGDFIYDLDEIIGASRIPLTVGAFEVFGDR